MKRLWLGIILVGLLFAWETKAVLRIATVLTANTFADLQGSAPNVRDGMLTYCTDCKAPSSPGAACESGGPGAEAHRIRGTWSCF